MKKLVIIALALLLLSACSQKPMAEEEKIKNLQYILKSDDDEKIIELLKQTEEAIGISEYKNIRGLDSDIEKIDYTVCFSAIDGSNYYAHYTNEFKRSFPILMRIRKDNFMDGELIWNIADQGIHVTVKQNNDRRCFVLIENWNGTLEFSMSFRIYKKVGEDWETAAEVSGIRNKEIKTGFHTLMFDWYDAYGSLGEGSYKIVIPAHCHRYDTEGQEYEEDIELSAEFVIGD